MTTGAAFEIQLRCRAELSCRQHGTAGSRQLTRLVRRNGRRRALIREFALGRAGVTLARCAVFLAKLDAERRNLLGAYGGQVVTP